MIEGDWHTCVREDGLLIPKEKVGSSPFDRWESSYNFLPSLSTSALPVAGVPGLTELSR